MKYLLDTNIVSQLGKRHPDQRVIRWIDAQSTHTLHIASVTLAEMCYGVELSRRKHPPSHTGRIVNALDELMQIYYGRILPFEEVAAQYWGKLMSHDSNHPLDAQIAAIAIAHDAVLVTSDQGFHQFARRLRQENVDLRVVDPLTTGA